MFGFLNFDRILDAQERLNNRITKAILNISEKLQIFQKDLDDQNYRINSLELNIQSLTEEIRLLKQKKFLSESDLDYMRRELNDMFLRGESKLLMVKRYKEITGDSLMDSKRAVESMFDFNRAGIDNIRK